MKIITEVEKIDSVFTGSPSPVADNPEACDLCISATEENGVILNWKFRFTIKHIQQLNQFVKKLQSIQDSINYQNNRFYFAEIEGWLHGHKLITRIEYIDFEANVLDVEDIPWTEPRINTVQIMLVSNDKSLELKNIPGAAAIESLPIEWETPKLESWPIEITRSIRSGYVATVPFSLFYNEGWFNNFVND